MCFCAMTVTIPYITMAPSPMPNSMFSYISYIFVSDFKMSSCFFLLFFCCFSFNQQQLQQHNYKSWNYCNRLFFCYLDPDLETLLGNTHTRNLFFNDVMELKEFLAQRIHELSTESSSMLAYGQVYIV